MSLTPQDLQAIGTLMDEKLAKQKNEILAEVRTMQDRQTRDIAQVINQALVVVDQRVTTLEYATR